MAFGKPASWKSPSAPPIDGGNLNSLYAGLVPSSPAPAPAAAPQEQQGSSSSGPDYAALLAGLQAPAAPAKRDWYSGPMSPQEDPQFVAFQRALGYSDQQLMAQTAARKSMLQNSWNRQLPVYDDQLKEQQKGIGEDYLSRGVYSSGHRVMDQDNAALEQQNRMNVTKGNMQDQQADLDMQLQTQLADNRRKQAEEELAAQQRIAVAKAQGQGPQ